MATMTVGCPECGHKFKTKDGKAEEKTACPKCGRTFFV